MTSTSDAVPTTSREQPHSRAGGTSPSRLRLAVKGVEDGPELVPQAKPAVRRKPR